MSQTQFKNAQEAFYYARDVIGDRCHEAEEAIMHDSYYAYNYAKYIIKDRWLEAEEIIAKHTEYRQYYARYFFPSQEVITRDEVTEWAWRKSGAVGFFAPRESFKQQISVIDIGVQL